PYIINGKTYYVFVSYDSVDDEYFIAGLTEKEIKASHELLEQKIYSAKRREAAEIEAFKKHEEEKDAFLKNLNPSNRVAIGLADVSVNRVLGFLEAVGAGSLAEDFKLFVSENRLFKVTGNYEIPNSMIDHASNIGIHVKERKDPKDLEQTIIHEVLAKAGIPGEVNNAEDIVSLVNGTYEKYLNNSLNDADINILVQKIYFRTDKQIDIKNRRFVDLNAIDGRDYSSEEEKSSLQNAIEEINEWKKGPEIQDDPHVLNSRSDVQLFQTKLQETAYTIYGKHKLYRLSLGDRLKFCLATFDEKNFSTEQHIIRLILNRTSLDLNASGDCISAEDVRRVANLLSSVGSRYSILVNKNTRFIMNLMLDISAKERRIDELEWFVGEIDKELETPGSGALPMVVTMQDIHAGQRRATSLLGFAAGLEADVYNRINNVDDLERMLAENGIVLEAIDARFVGFNDKADRGMDPIGSFRLVQWLSKTKKLKHFSGNHDMWRSWGVLLIHVFFDGIREELLSPKMVKIIAGQVSLGAIGNMKVNDLDAALKNELCDFEFKNKALKPMKDAMGDDFFMRIVGKIRDELIEELKKTEPETAFELETMVKDKISREFDYSNKDLKNHHIGYWAKEAFAHAGWGNVEIDQVNEEKFNRQIERVNTILRAHGIPTLDGLDLASERTKNEGEMKRLKKQNAAIRSENEINKNNKDYVRKDEHKLPKMLEVTLEYLGEQIKDRNEKIARLNKEYNLDIAPIEFEIVDLSNYHRDPGIIERALWELQNFRLFYVDILGNLHTHTVLPFDFKEKKIDVKYKGLQGLPALELMQEDIRMFFEDLTTIPDSMAFRKKLWEELGEAFTIINSWYSDKLASAKAVAVKEFIDAGGPVGLGDEIMGFPVDGYSARPVSFLMIIGHNERGKFNSTKTPLPMANVFPDTGSGVLLIDYELSEGYADRGAILTFFKRDERGRITGLRLWGYADKGSKVIEDITFLDTKGLSEEQLSFLGTLADGERFMKWIRLRSLVEIKNIMEEVIDSAREEGRNSKVTDLILRKQKIEEKIAQTEEIEVPNLKGKESLAEIIVNIFKHKDTFSEGKPITNYNVNEWCSNEKDGWSISKKAVAEALALLEQVGMLEVLNKDTRKSTDPLAYGISNMVSGLEVKDIEEICERVKDLKETDIPAERVPVVKAGIIKIISEKIHMKNLTMAPSLSENKILYLIVPKSMVPVSQWNMVQKISQSLVKSKGCERIILVEEPSDIVPKALEVKQQGGVPLVACPNAEILEKLSNEDVKGLIFEGELGQFRQFEGMLGALRAYYNNDLLSLKEMYTVLTGKTSPEIDDISNFAKRVVFMLPPMSGLQDNDITDLNANQELLVLFA
ncbi:MAG: hypothetical protein PHW46_03555, partial [Candidatus Omnitrophica bacterium]|nr:hypothetical protein [Candidatus Omnitrophota bacterium]